MRLASLLCLLVVTACAQPQTIHVTDYGTPEEWAPYQGTGDGAIEGQAFLRQQGGGVVTCAGDEVLIFPATPSMQRMVARIRAERSRVDLSASPSYARGGRKTICDAQGNFRVDGLPPGEWFVNTDVIWTVGYYQQGGGLIGRVTVPPGGVGKVYLTDADKI